MMKLLVDVHGVVANFVKAFCEYHELVGVYENWPKGNYDIAEVTGIDWGEFPIKYLSDLPIMDDLDSIVEVLEKHQIIFVSRASNEDMATATHAWLQKHFAPANMLACNDLKAFSVPPEVFTETVLIDDCDAEVDAWRQCGGKAVLLPRPWNSGKGDPAKVLEEQLMLLDCDSDEGYINNGD